MIFFPFPPQRAHVTPRYVHVTPHCVCVDAAVVEFTTPMPHHAVTLGTWRVSEDAVCYDYIVNGVKDFGFRAVDTAAIYKNEETIGRAFKTVGAQTRPADVDPSGAASSTALTVRLTTKISPFDTKKGAAGVAAGVEAALKRLNTDRYVDTILLHWPGTTGLKIGDPLNLQRRREAWGALDQARKQGYCRAIGVSNYLPAHLESVKDIYVPDAIQCEWHPLCRQRDVVDYCRQNGILRLEAYSPLAAGDPRLLKHAAFWSGEAPSEQWTSFQRDFSQPLTPGQALLLWSAHSAGLHPVVTSKSPAHLAEAAAVSLSLDAAGYDGSAALKPNVKRPRVDGAAPFDAAHIQQASEYVEAHVAKRDTGTDDFHVCWYSAGVV